MANRDLRDWIEGVRAAGELKVIAGAEPKEEIGGIVDIYMRKMGNPAVLFDEVPGFPKGHRVIANILTSIPRVNLALGLPPETARDGADPVVAQLFQERAVEADEGRQRRPADGQRVRGDDVDIEKIPTPVWHEHDGGPYIGTGCLVTMKDPDSGWINYGTYRVQSHAPNVASVMMSPGKHGRIIMRKYHERGEPCPVAVVAGMHPVLLMLGGIEIPYGKNELEAAGGILGEPVEVINMPKTGLPVPANCGDRLRRPDPSRRQDRGRAARRVDRLLRQRQRSRACDPHRHLDVSRRPHPGGRDPGRAAQRQHLLFWFVPLWRGVEPARSGGHPRR